MINNFGFCSRYNWT